MKLNYFYFIFVFPFLCNLKKLRNVYIKEFLYEKLKDPFGNTLRSIDIPHRGKNFNLDLDVFKYLQKLETVSIKWWCIGYEFLEFIEKNHIFIRTIYFF